MVATPLSHWIGFHLLILALLALELVYSRWRGPSKVQSTSVAATILWVAAALGFAAFIFHTIDSASGVEYLASYAIEEALSIDNLFVFLLLFRVFQIEPHRQPKVLFWGVLGAIVMRGAFISAGVGLLDHFHWIGYIFGAILLVAAVRLVLPHEKEEETTPVWIKWVAKLHPVSLRQDHFFVRENGQRMMTMLFLALIAIEFTDVVFALDSIPAVLSITRHPFIAYTSNIMAVMGLRSLYFLLANMLEKLRFLHYGLAAVLAFAAIKMLGSAWFEIGPMISLGVIVGLLGVCIALSLLMPAKPHAEAKI
ncbi:tellurite resistance protein TerC [Granulicella aggregans]|jgi:tellurite resistance protein TerC|uniref:Tellurite resistance protein TerC n=1 Tax=Granulicella aggregans TaxID=474949 RepID=A0A7W7Z9R5_9BACT|nr:TerC/Alx family metal homeostasis membrane protein [Granulicella aggregans]MBB5055767.1 tellurite resistance protein TerC [Granulicella aggregans]